MSGPKVVRVITKQEIMANCRSRIDALQDVIDQWRKFAIKHDSLAIQEEKAVEEEFQSIVRMFEQEQFDAVQNRCTFKMVSIQDDIIRIRNEAIAKVEQERSMRRRLQYSAETLIKTFEDAGLQIPEELSSIASAILIANQSDLSNISSTLSRILTKFSISAAENKNITPLQMKLSKQLTEGERLQTLAEWKIQHDLDIKAADADRKLDKLLAEIEAIENESIAKPFIARVASIANELLASQKSLLTDSLIFDLTAYLNEQKVKDEAIASMIETHNALRRLTTKQTKDIETQLAKAIVAGDIKAGKVLKEKASDLLKTEAKVLASTSRREAILKGLSELGYEVRENMATAWAENGRIVVKKPNEKDYGIELGAARDIERVQVQLVSIEHSNEAHNASQDLDRETIWCSEFSQLKLLLQKSGTALHIEKTLPIGAKPLKRVKESTVSAAREQRTKSPSSKQKQQNV